MAIFGIILNRFFLSFCSNIPIFEQKKWEKDAKIKQKEHR